MAGTTMRKMGDHLSTDTACPSVYFPPFHIVVPLNCIVAGSGHSIITILRLYDTDDDLPFSCSRLTYSLTTFYDVCCDSICCLPTSRILKNGLAGTIHSFLWPALD